MAILLRASMTERRSSSSFFNSFMTASSSSRFSGPLRSFMKSRRRLCRFLISLARASTSFILALFAISSARRASLSIS